jgi:hypothetical protein
MAGKHVDRGGETMPARILHVGGKLGFHAPYLDQGTLQDRRYDRKELVAAHSAALNAINGAINLFNYRVLESESDLEWKPWVRPSLFAEMLSRGPDELYLIDTIGKAGRWNIGLRGVAGPEVPDAVAFKTACENYLNWKEDKEDDPARDIDLIDEDTKFFGDEWIEAMRMRHLTVFSIPLGRSIQVCAIRKMSVPEDVLDISIASYYRSDPRTEYVPAWYANKAAMPLVFSHGSADSGVKHQPAQLAQ